MLSITHLCYTKYMNRLFSQFIPEHYTIQWNLSRARDKRRITGTTIIVGQQVVDGTIRLHAKDLNISRVLVNQQEVSEFFAKNDELIIPHPGANQVTIAIEFSLRLTDAMHGIYPCYFKVDGKQRELYATQFESHHAREAFPCIDEPEAKATFDISLVSDQPVLLSNMPIVSQQSGITTFATTPRMSTYLVAFAAGDLQRATTRTASGVEVNVYATMAQPAASLSWALDHAARTIDFFNEYFGVPYPLPKSDHIALPDFSSGAMENWGLITYREIALLADPATTSISSKQYIATVIAHELSHQWFGNLVTMKWWNNLWLNESFATLMEYLATDALHPEWQQWDEFASNEGVAALRRDCIDGVQPVQVDVSSPAEISALFDGAIVYAKGGRLLRMVQTWIGDDAFRRGLTDYFTKFQYDNTTGDDLWQCLSTASGKDVGALMNTWISQPGYPVVRATLADGKLTLSQEQFFVGPHQPNNRLWPIPLGANDSRIPDILADASVAVSYAGSDMLLLNAANTGHFITLYDDELRGRIMREILAGTLESSVRAQYLNEQLLLMRGGLLPSSTLVDLLSVYKNESDQKVWEIISLALSELKKFVDHDTAAEHMLRTFTADLARTQYIRLGWSAAPGEPEQDTKLRAIVIGCMLYGEDAGAIRQARELYRANTLEQLDAELRPLIIGAVVRHDQQPHNIVRSLLQMYENSASAELRSDIASGVTATRDLGELKHLIRLLTNTRVIRTQDTVHWFVDLLRNREGRELAWKWLRDSWRWIEKTFASDKSHDYFPRYAASLLMTRQQLAEYRDFFTPLRNDQSLVRAIDMGLLDLEGKLDLIDRDAPGVIAALSR
ncbi:M1 family peptidase [TM7 phylum sp. oral taxon 349]|nr:M1 family peptidase [TM7 phylum sp. oral taxon 349]